MSILLSLLGVDPVKGGAVHVMLNDNMFAPPYTMVDLAPDKYKEEYLKCTISPTTAVSRMTRLMPSSMRLEQNRPNPFNPTTTISFQLPAPGMVSLKIFNILGKEIATLFEEHRDAGEYSFIWDAGHSPSGVYFYQLEVDGRTSVKKMVLIK